MTGNYASRIGGLDALRGEAALCVMLFHLDLFGDWLPQAKFGFLAVDLFFLLSGYVMARTYEHRMLSGLTCRGFMGLRLRRLWPLLAVGAALGAVQMALGGSTAAVIAVDLVLALLLLPNLLRIEPFPINGPAWSVFYELIANAVHASLLWRLSNRALAWVTGALVMGYLALVPHTGLDTGNLNETLLAGLPRVFAAYLLGVAIHRLERSGRLPVAAPSFHLPGLLTATLALFAVGPELDNRMIAVAVFVLFSLLVMQARSTTPGPILLFFGRISFPLYAVHVPVLKTFDEHQLPLMGAVGLSVISAAGLAWLERRLRDQWKKRQSRSAPPRNTALPAAR